MQSPAGGKTGRITWAKKKIFMMFVLNLIFVHQSSLHPKYKQLCINGPFWAQELGRYIFYCDVLNLTFVYKTSLHPKHKRFILWALWAQGCGVYIFHCDLLNQLFLHQTSLHQKQERLCLWALWLEGWGRYIFYCSQGWGLVSLSFGGHPEESSCSMKFCNFCESRMIG